MARPVQDIAKDIRALSREDRVDLLREVIAELDGAAEPGAERAWLETAQRRYRELVEGRVEGIPGPEVFARLRARLDG